MFPDTFLFFNRYQFNKIIDGKSANVKVLTVNKNSNSFWMDNTRKITIDNTILDIYYNESTSQDLINQCNTMVKVFLCTILLKNHCLDLNILCFLEAYSNI